MQQPKIKIASVQMTSSHIVNDNLKKAEEFIIQAAKEGAQIVILPEYFALLDKDEYTKIGVAEIPKKGKVQQKIAELAKENKVYIVAGTIPMQSPVKQKIYNSLIVFDPQGEQIGRYNKVHLFNYTSNDEAYHEDKTIVPGKDVLVIDTPFARIGFAICYDLRFPELFRKMDRVDMIILPAAFTYTTGKAHWEILCRARAIENQCYFVSSAQTGDHPSGRKTFGHSMVINPWGEIIASLDENEGVLYSEIDFGKMENIRQQLPALNHRVFF